MELMNQPFTGQLGNRIIELLDSSEYHTLNIVVAFAKNSGVLRVKDAFERFREQGGIINIYVGVDMGGTSYEALTALLLYTNSLNVVHFENDQTFHPKIYQFLGNDKELIVVGSHNLTAGGLWTNFESSVFISLDKASNNSEITIGLKSYIEQLAELKDSFMPISTQEDIDKLLQNEYVFKEVAEQVERSKTKTENKRGQRLFANGISAKMPHIVKHKPKLNKKKKDRELDISTTPTEPSIILPSDDGQTIWFETRKMTGGSRNILDLSKKSLVERGDLTGTAFDLGESKFMRGGVEFFGLNPAITNQSKDIIINFEGVDYIGNTILFPSGAKANGTWRLQIKGISSSGESITEALRAKGEKYYLVKKVVTFTKIQSNYYFMSVFLESELEKFKAASYILARNGSSASARWMGMFKGDLATLGVSLSDSH